MNIAIIGTGYVGLPTGVAQAELGHTVTCIDNDPVKVEMLRSGLPTIYEDGLEELLRSNVAKGRLRFTTSMAEGVPGKDIVMIAVGTPPHPVTGEADMQYIHAAARELAPYLDGYTAVVIKSTVPVGTGDAVDKIIRDANPTADFDMVSLPEFLREGFALHDFFNPDRIIVGANSERAKKTISELYAPLAHKTKMLFVKRQSSELIKYASNAFLAVKIHYINEMADYCEKTEADIAEVAQGMGLDSRIGNRFLNPGPGYGGSCFPKDTSAMAYMGRSQNIDLTLIETVLRENDNRKLKMAARILDALHGIPSPRIAILGLAFKDGTDDCRQSPAMEIIEALLKHNVRITAYDPKGMPNARLALGDKIAFAETMEATLKDADILAILTEWKEFATLDLEEAKALMRRPHILDLRNLLDPANVCAAGFTYQSVGRQ